MSADYIPASEPLLAAWAANFSTLITATPGAYGLMASDAATIAAAYTLFNDALTRASNPATKTKPSVADKNAKKLAMLATLRPYAQVIKRNRGVSNDAKIALGLRVDNTGRSPVPAPTTVPVLRLVSGAPLCQNVSFNDSASPSRKAKPAGVTGLMLQVTVGDTPPDPGAAPVYGIATRPNFMIQFATADKGKNAFYYGRWMTRAGLLGPWSAMATLSIAG